MPWYVEIEVAPGEWKKVHPTGGKPYRFKTEEEADQSMNMMYPHECLVARLGGIATVRTWYRAKPKPVQA